MEDRKATEIARQIAGHAGDLLNDAATYMDPGGEFRVTPPDGYADTEEAWSEDAAEFSLVYFALTESDQHTVRCRAKKQLIAAELIGPVWDALNRLRTWYDSQTEIGDNRVSEAITELQRAYDNLRLLREDKQSKRWHHAMDVFRTAFPEITEKE